MAIYGQYEVCITLLYHDLIKGRYLSIYCSLDHLESLYVRYYSLIVICEILSKYLANNNISVFILL
jgi:hypothetical protein